MSITKSQFGKGQSSLPPGEYEIEIQAYEHEEGVSQASGKPWERGVFRSSIISPKQHDGRKFSFSIFYTDYKIEKLLQACKKASDDVFTGEDLDHKKLESAVCDSFIKVKIGIKNGYNELADIILEGKNENQKEEV